MIDQGKSTEELAFSWAEFYRHFEPDYLLGENVILTQPILDYDGNEIPAGTPAKITARWFSEIYGFPVNMFFVGIELPTGLKIFGKHIWNKIAAAENHSRSKLWVSPQQIICPTK